MKIASYFVALHETALTVSLIRLMPFRLHASYLIDFNKDPTRI
jgi:hypothetical protein